jgi:hypothetical protein
VAISTNNYDALMPMKAATSRQPHISCSDALDMGKSDDMLHTGSRVLHAGSPNISSLRSGAEMAPRPELHVGMISAPFAVMEMTPGCTSAAPTLLSWA